MKRNNRLEDLISILDDTLDEKLKVKLMKRMKDEIHDPEHVEDKGINFNLLTRKILL